MKTEAIVYTEYGGPEKLKLMEIHVPEPGPHEVLVDVLAAGINPVDYKVMSGDMKMITGKVFPKIPGWDLAGTVKKAGTASGFSPGQRVAGLTFGVKATAGSLAKQIVVHKDMLTTIPDNVDFVRAGAIGCAGLTALQSILDLAKAKSGQSILINGASGGVGSYGIQIAKIAELEISGVASGRNEELVRKLGATKFYDYTQDRIPEKQFDIVFDPAGKRTYRQGRRFLKNTGRFVSTEPSPSMLIAWLSFWGGRKAKFIMVKPKIEDLITILTWLSEKKMESLIHKVYPMSDYRAAFDELMNGKITGKIVISMDE